MSGFGNYSRLSGLMEYGGPAQMSRSPDVPALAYTGESGQVAPLGMDAGMMNYGMTPVSPEIAQGFPGQNGGGLMDTLTSSKFWLGGRDASGFNQVGAAPVALGALQGAASLWMGMQQYNLAKKTLSENKRQFDMNYGAQKTLTNARLEDRQKARVADGRPGAYESVDSYMAKNGVK